jgi:hypothetical protein
LTSRTKTEKESESVITMCDRMQMYNIITSLACKVLDAGLILGLSLDPADGGDIFTLNVG